MRFQDRADAGRRLAVELMPYREESPLVLGLPRGGVPVAREVARALTAPLDIWVVRKVGAPFQPELGLGAVAEGGALFLDWELARALGCSETEVLKAAEQESEEVAERIQHFRGAQPPPRIEGQTVILVDDGIATGGTMRAALRALRQQHPRKVVLAVPVAAEESLEALRPEVDEVVCLYPARYLRAVGEFYDNFRQTSDAEVQRMLAENRTEFSQPGSHRALESSDLWWT